MSELRQNMATKEWVIIAPERAMRPDQFRPPDTKTQTHQLPALVSDCPFCPGNEHETLEEVLRMPEEGPWKLRVIPNKHSALSRTGERRYHLDGVQRSLTGVGHHEVLIETPRHNSTPGLQSPTTIRRTLDAFQQRGRELSQDSRVEQIFYFKNHGVSAGSSIVHSHSQLLALPMVPRSTRVRVEEMRHSYDDLGLCPICLMLENELADGRRIIGQNANFVAFVPYAALSPFHMWLVPRRHGPTFLDQMHHELDALAHLMREILGRLYHGLGDPAFNYIIRSAPQRDSSSAYLHWYVSVVPRVTRTAGFELGSGMSINPTLPEDNAAFLRNQDPGDVIDDETEATRPAPVVQNFP